MHSAMKNKKIVIAGGSGFIGEELIRIFGKYNDICILTRQLPNATNNRNHYRSLAAEDLTRVQFEQWDGRTTGSWISQLENADLLINLAGKTVNCRYTPKNKAAILDSRIDAVNVLARALSLCKRPPSCWINASSATIYRHATDRPQDEYNGEFQDDFSTHVCKAWEKTFYQHQTPHTRKIALRMAIVIGSGGVLVPYLNLIKFGLGGPQGNGKQRYSWVHIDDTAAMISWLFTHEQLEGTFNCCSPFPVTNKIFMQTLRNATGCRIGLPVYEWMLKLGAVIVGTETELVLKSRWVLPTRIGETGYQFRHPFLEDALEDLIKKIPRKQYHLF